MSEIPPSDIAGKTPAAVPEPAASAPEVEAGQVAPALAGSSDQAAPEVRPSAALPPAATPTATPTPAAAAPVPPAPPIASPPPFAAPPYEKPPYVAPASGHSLAEAMQRPLTLAVAVLAVLLGAQWWSSNNEIRALREEMAKRLQTSDVSSAETRLLAKSANDSSKELHAKYSVLESRQAEAQSQQLALEHLYQELSKNRDDWALAEIEQVLSTADQQLQLAGNVQGALIALQNADRTLARSDKPQFLMIRRAIAKDMDRLKALPNLDLPGIAVRLDSAISQIDSLPLLSDEKPAQAALPPKKTARSAPPKAAPSKLASSQTAPAEEPGFWASLAGSVANTWDSFSSEMWLEMRQLIRVRSVENPAALMMSPSQAYFARENVKLRLLNARLALLSRNETAFRSDLAASQDAIVKYFDTRAKQTQTVQTLLRQVQGSSLSIEMPTLSESVNAVRNPKH